MVCKCACVEWLTDVVVGEHAIRESGWRSREHRWSPMESWQHSYMGKCGKEQYSLNSGQRYGDYCLWIQLWANKDNNTYLEAGCNLPQANQVQKKGQRRTKNKTRRSGLRRTRTFTAVVVDEDKDWKVKDMFFKGHRNMLQSNLFLARFMFKFVNYKMIFQYTTLF